MEQSHTIRYLVSILKGRKCSTLNLQIKNIKLHIVTDIKVTINSLSAFGFRYLGGGEGFCKQRKVIVVHWATPTRVLPRRTWSVAGWIVLGYWMKSVTRGDRLLLCYLLYGIYYVIYYIIVIMSCYEDAVLKIWNASRICVSSLRRGHANLLCIVPILIYVLPEQTQS